MIKARITAIVLLVPLVGSIQASAQADSDPLAQLKSCARIEDSSARMECYDSLGKQVIAEEGAGETDAATVAPAQQVTEIAAAPAATNSSTEGGSGATDATVSASAATAAPTAAEQTAAVAATASPALDEEIGGDKFEPEPVDNKQPDRGTVIACQLDVNEKYYFSFANGQVWHQTGSRRQRLNDDCQFVATISKDTFGYKMQIDGEKGKIHVKRVR